MATIKTIAKIAGVSHTTVSRALNGNPAVKEKTRQKIQKIATELGYSPNLSARGLVNNKTYTIGLFFSSIQTGTSTSFLTEVITRLHNALDKEYMLSVNGIDDLSNYNIAVKSRLDGVVVVSQSQNDDEFIDFVKKNGLPLVVLNRLLQRHDVANVGFDDYAGTYQAMEYAVRLGHKTFGMIEGIDSFESSSIRRKAFLDCVNKHHLNILSDAVVPGTYDASSGYRAMKQILLLPEFPTLIFCANDDMAIGALKACHELNVRVPEDISLIGFDDSVYAAFINPALTTIRKPIDKLSELGLQMFDQVMNNPEYQLETKLVSPELIIRDSVKNLNATD
ncbi:LacI family DNA-binding transcriptional regulator [Loigolactobacillus jiayinensis]|uniref:LacI family DNA-binding transcriptional regulator n=1 Tax=Loigolactobacillus jiayinensis TaxID=2486016 RepID=A0ABW1REP4_9LACO|nr:LacI family DNA-binding transcriptional regulator [Loigolactobacillus jiayinensis]